MRLVFVLLGLLAGLAWPALPAPVVAAGTVGDGTAASCTGAVGEAALDDALSGGGAVSFNCGADPITITVTSEKVIEDNTQIDGGGLVTLSGGDATRIFLVNSGATLALSNITLSNGDSGSANGGAILNSGTVSITNSTLSDNHANHQGGAISNDRGTLTITNSTLSNNSAFGSGGAIYNDGGTLTITASTLRSNHADGSGGAISTGGTLTITSSTLSGNVAETFGGAIFHDSGTTTITNSTLSGNRVIRIISDGGAIYSDAGTLIITGSTLSGNSGIRGFGRGGAIYSEGTTTVTSSTLSGNEARNGGAIYNRNGTLTITSSTLSSNNATGDSAEGGAIYNDGGTVTLLTSILANSTGGNCAGAAPSSLGYNLSDDDSCNLSAATNDLPNTEPLLADLADNGGSTQTHLPLPGSPGIDAIPVASCATDDQGATLPDQRGITRPQNGLCEIGSVEVRNVAPTITGVSASPTALDEGGSSTISVTATDPEDDDDGTLDYEFDCDGNDSFEVGPQEGSQTTCDYPDDGLVTVTVRVSDSTGLTNTGTVEVTVSNVAPTIALSGANSITEGSSHTLTLGAVTDPGPDTVTTYTVHWGDGTTESFSTAGAKTHTYADGTVNATITVDLTDEDGIHPDAGTLTLTITNVVPTIALSGAASVAEGSLYTLTLGTVTDPGQDTVTTYTVHWGDGSSDSYNAAGNVTHTYVDGPAARTISVDLVDEDGTHPAAGTLNLSVTNVALTIVVSGATAVAEGSTYTLTLGEVTDPGQDTVTAYTVHWGDGTTESFTTAGPKTHVYADGPASATITVDLTDEDGTYPGAATHGPVTIDNAAPTIDQLTATIEGDEIVVAVQASDPAGANDPLTYAFDCGTSGDIDIGPQDTTTARCPLGVLGGSQQIRVVVSDGDGGETEGFTSVAIDYALCAGPSSGLLREMPSSGCAWYETSVSLPEDGPLTVCVALIGGFMRAGEDCARSEWSLVLPDDGPLTVCVNPLSWLLRAPDGPCAWYEIERMIGGAPVR